jgi:hypothetical protein
VQIEKRISFSLDGVWADWWLSSKHPEAHQRDFSFSRFLISLGSKTGTPFLPEYAKLCQSYFCFYCKIFWKVKRETVEALCGTFGGVRLLASLFFTRRSIESDAMKHSKRMREGGTRCPQRVGKSSAAFPPDILRLRRTIWHRLQEKPIHPPRNRFPFVTL